jgi:hypothetical protein
MDTSAPFEPTSLAGIIAYPYSDSPDEEFAVSAAFRHVITLPGLIGKTLDTLDVVRQYAPNLGWKRLVAWSRDPHSCPVGGLAQPHAKPDQMVAIYDWPVESEVNENAKDLRNSPDTWGPSLGRRLYLEAAKEEALIHSGGGPVISVPMTFQWKRMADPMAGFYS